MGVLTRKRVRKKDDATRFEKTFSSLWLCAVALFAVMIWYLEIRKYRAVVVGYKAGNYAEVEGVVSELEEIPARWHERFRIDDVVFEYSMLPWNNIAYTGRAGYGDAIAENGQCVRVRYVPYGKENYIVYIGQKSE